MNLKVRKTLVSGLTATALIFSGTAVASAADTNTTTAEDSSSKEWLSSSEDGEDSEVTPKLIKEYVDMVVSIIRALDAAMSLIPQPK